MHRDSNTAKINVKGGRRRSFLASHLRTPALKSENFSKNRSF